MMSLLWMWFRGYVTIRLRGPGIERLFNKAAEEKIALFKIERLTSDVVIARLGIKEFCRLRPLLWGTQINLSILDKHGGPFLIHRLKQRGFLALGLLLSLLIVVYLANFIWFIEIEGNETISLGTLRVAAEDLGLKTGIARSGFEPRQIETALLKRFPVLAWVQVNVEGVKVSIQLAEREALSFEDGGAGHLYARADGVVTEIRVLRGTAQVEIADTVRKDDILISGVYYDGRGRKQFGAAQGVVKARVWYQGVGEAPLIKWEPIKTGREHRQYLLTIGPLTIPIGRSYPQETHLKEIKGWGLSLGSAMVPVKWSRVDYQEVRYEARTVPLEEANNTAYDLAWKSLIGHGIDREDMLEERRQQDLMVDGEGIRVTIWVEILEDIGQFFSQ